MQVYPNRDRSLLLMQSYHFLTKEALSFGPLNKQTYQAGFSFQSGRKLERKITLSKAALSAQLIVYCKL